MKKMLIAIDDSEGSLKVVDYVGRQFAGLSDLWITLFHVLLAQLPQFQAFKKNLLAREQIGGT